MKRIVACICIVAMILSLCACGSNKVDESTPEYMIKQFCDAVKNYDLATLDSLMIVSNQDYNTASSTYFADYLNDEGNIWHYITTQLTEWVSSASYEIVSVETTETTSKIQVSFNHADASMILIDAYSNFFSNILAYSDASDVILKKAFANEIADSCEENETVTDTTTVNFICLKKEDGWKVYMFDDDEIWDVLTSDLYSTFSEL